MPGGMPRVLLVERQILRVDRRVLRVDKRVLRVSKRLLRVELVNQYYEWEKSTTGDQASNAIT